jgi:outer membrane protein assembly factor BamE (lipoprotein component of BamABCDE complex)
MDRHALPATGSVRLLLPLALILLGIGTLSGCLFIPAFNPTIEGRNAAKEVGDAGSRTPIQVGRATRADVLRTLGHPWQTNEAGTKWMYEWSVRNGLVVWPLCFQAYPQDGKRTLVLEFGPDDRVRSFEVLAIDGNLMHDGPYEAPVPADVRQERQARWRRPVIISPATAPTTGPS